MKCQILLQKKALRELIWRIKTIENEEYIDHGMVSLFCHLHHVTQNFKNINNTDQTSLIFQTSTYIMTTTIIITHPFWYTHVPNLPCGKNLFSIPYYNQAYFLHIANLV